MLKKLLIISLVCMGMMLCGCQTLTRDPEQQNQKYSRIADLNRRMLAEDIDAILMLERQSNLSPYHIRSR